MYKAFGIVKSSGRNIYVDGMQDYRPIGAFSFLGRYRVIDFPISNVITTSTPRAVSFSFSSQSIIMTMIFTIQISPATWKTWNL